LYSGLN